MSNSEPPTIYIDFHNADAQGFVRLNSVGTTNDLARLKIILADGLQLRGSDGEIAVVGIVRAPGPEGVWRLQIDWDDVRKEVSRGYVSGE